MKIGIISDIHGNIKALEAVLKEFDNRQIDKIICLGDMIGGAPMSEEVIQKIMKIEKEIIVVMGNREKYIIEGLPKLVHDEKMEVTLEQRERFEWIKKQLSDTTKKYIYSLPKEIVYEVHGWKIYIAHYPMNKDGNYKKHIKNASIEENEEMFKDINADIYLYGHTHKEIYNTKSNKMYINPGALGCPKKTDYACCGILKISKEKVDYEKLHVKYNVQEVIDYIEKIKFPGYKGVLKLFYGIDD